MELYIHFPIHLLREVLDELSIRAILSYNKMGIRRKMRTAFLSTLYHSYLT
jgi:hypothetical protein